MEFYSVRNQLNETDGDDSLWPIMRGKLLKRVQDGREFGDLAYIWGIAPKVPTCRQAPSACPALGQESALAGRRSCFDIDAKQGMFSRLLLAPC